MLARTLKSLTAAALISFAVPALAEPTEEQNAANRVAEAQGRTLYLHDQAAWHGTDALREEIDFADHPELRGYVIDPMENGNLGLVFFAEDDEGLYEFARYEVAESEVVGGGRIESDTRIVLSPMLLRLVQARQVAVEEFWRQEWSLCTENPANFAALPPDEDGNIATYLLTSTSDAGMVPFGGHYRIDINPAGEVVAARKFTNSCLNMPFPQPRDGQVPAGMGISHALDDHPTEIHYFQSNYTPVPLFVILDDGAWVIDKGEFQKIEQLPDQ